jgi:acyl-coenzyme A synthetase/AMP-(fatty) acid ligase
MLIKNLLDLWNNINPSTFYIEEKDKKYSKKDFDDCSSQLSSNLLSINKFWENNKVYVDIKDRFLFIVAFITLLKFKAKLVLVPIEAKQEDYVFDGGIFISDNKNSDNVILIKRDLSASIKNTLKAKNVVSDNDCDIFLYTSGSTGKAKLIPKTSEGLLIELEELKKIFKVTSSDLFYFTPPIYHIYGFLNGFLLPLAASSPIVLDYFFTPESIAKIVSEKNITNFVSIPSYYKMFVDLKLIYEFKKCKRFASSSALLPLDVSKSFYKEKISIVEIYGSTETGGIATRIGAASEEWEKYSYIEILIDKTKKIEDKTENKDIYELLIKSPTISVEYSDIAGFNTGDIVEVLENTKFKLVGRNTRFVKISGKRVDLKYVFEKMKEYLSSYVSVPINEQNLYVGEKEEKIFVIFEENFPKNSIEIKENLKEHLPGYAIPRLFLDMKIPRNEMGKINKVKIEEIISNYLK